MKRALITGGSGAIGAAICRALAADGLHVVVHANSRLDAAQVLAEEIRAAGGSAEAVCFDVASAADTSTALDKLLQDGAIQVLVNNAGIHRDGILAGMSQEQL
ncbi:MAG: SDR family NAD(P)-dependent oxidoreductase, partial [Sulfurimicrobium sp.]|nr:SDR family NAD(P)-dependent oxidoreductase [Sulfurimicrobium sp.]